MLRNIQVYKIIQRRPNKINKKTYNQVLLWDVCLHNNKNLFERRAQKLKAFSFIKFGKIRQYHPKTSLCLI